MADRKPVLRPGQRVEVKWNRRGWLPGTFRGYETSPDPGEDFLRVHAEMDNGFSCTGTGYHPDCVRPC
jgi:hypothetical protein